MKYGYNLYGLKVNTTLKIDGFACRDKYIRPDAIINFAKVDEPAQGLPETFYKPYTIFNKEFYYLNIPSIAKFYVNKGDQVTIELKDRKKKKDAIVFFKDTILSILLIKNKRFPINASAVTTKDGIYLFTSAEGEGKSSLAAQLCLMGYQFMSDDKFVMTWDKKKKTFTGKCYSPEIELWDNVLPLFKNEPSRIKKKLIRKELKKYTIDFSNRVCKKKLPVKAIFNINVENEMIKPEMKQLTGFKKMSLLKNAIHMNHIIDVIGINQDLFKLNMLVSKKVPIINVSRSRVMVIKKFARFINNEILTKAAFS